MYICIYIYIYTYRASERGGVDRKMTLTPAEVDFRRSPGPQKFALEEFFPLGSGLVSRR